MIKINVNKKKTIEFDVNIMGVQCEALDGRLSLFYEGLIYSFPATIEDANVIKVELPPLNEIINDIPNKYQAVMKLEVVGNDTFMMPWSGSAHLEQPIQVEATMRGQKLVEEEIPTIEVEEVREEEQDTKPCPEGEQWCHIKKKCIKPAGQGKVDVEEATKYNLSNKEIAFLKKAADRMGKSTTWESLASRPDSSITKELLQGMKDGLDPSKAVHTLGKKKTFSKDDPKSFGGALAKAAGLKKKRSKIGEALSGEEEDKKRRKIKNKKLGKALAEALLIKEE